MSTRLERNHPKEAKKRQLNTVLEETDTISHELDGDDVQISGRLGTTDRMKLNDLYRQKQQLQDEIDRIVPKRDYGQFSAVEKSDSSSYSSTVKKKKNIGKWLTYTIIIESILLAIVLFFAFMK